MAVFTLSNMRKAGNTKMGNEKKRDKKKEEERRKRYRNFMPSIPSRANNQKLTRARQSASSVRSWIIKKEIILLI